MAGQLELLFNVGEGLSYADLNQLQRIQHAVSANWLLGSMGQLEGGSVADAAVLDHRNHLFALGNAGAVSPSGTNLSVNIKGGPILQWPSTELTVAFLHSAGNIAGWGLDPKGFVYWVNDTELFTTHTAGDGANPRWDLVSVKLEIEANNAGDQETRLSKASVSAPWASGLFYKRRRIKITKTLTAGTPGASPVIPALPAGHVPLYAVRVPTGHTGVFTYTDLWDFRMPLGQFQYELDVARLVAEKHYLGAGSPTLPTNGMFNQYTAGGTTDAFWFRMTGLMHRPARLLGVASMQASGGSSTFSLIRGQFSGSGEVAISAYGSHSLDTALRGGVDKMKVVALNVTTALAGLPVWDTGYPNGYASRMDGAATGPTYEELVLKWVSGAAAAQLSGMRFYFAGGA